jgi:hypothetical protein
MRSVVRKCPETIREIVGFPGERTHRVWLAALDEYFPPRVAGNERCTLEKSLCRHARLPPGQYESGPSDKHRCTKAAQSCHG